MPCTVFSFTSVPFYSTNPKGSSNFSARSSVCDGKTSALNETTLKIIWLFLPERKKNLRGLDDSRKDTASLQGCCFCFFPLCSTLIYQSFNEWTNKKPNIFLWMLRFSDHILFKQLVLQLCCSFCMIPLPSSQGYTDSSAGMMLKLCFWSFAFSPRRSWSLCIGVCPHVSLSVKCSAVLLDESLPEKKKKKLQQ